MKELSKEEVWKALENVMHPEIDCSLVELGMIKDVKIKENRVIVTLALPFLGVPIREYLIDITREAVARLGTELDVEITEMNREELQNFLNKEREKWKGLQQNSQNNLYINR